MNEKEKVILSILESNKEKLISVCENQGIRVSKAITANEIRLALICWMFERNWFVLKESE